MDPQVLRQVFQGIAIILGWCIFIPPSIISLVKKKPSGNIWVNIISATCSLFWVLCDVMYFTTGKWDHHDILTRQNCVNNMVNSGVMFSVAFIGLIIQFIFLFRSK